MPTRRFPPPEDVGAAGQKLATTSLIFSVFLPAHEECRRDFEVPEFRLSRAVIDQHRFDFELCCHSLNFILQGLQFSMSGFNLPLNICVP